MKKLTKKEMVKEIERVLNSDIVFEEVEPLTELDIDDYVDRIFEETQTTINPGGKKMKENFVIGAKDVSQWKYGKKVKPSEATEAVVEVKAVKAVEAVAAVKANKKEGIEAVAAVAAVEAVKGVKGKPAMPATNGSIQMYFKAVSEEVAQEAVLRMVDQGLTVDNADDDGNAVFFDEVNKHWFFSFTDELDSALRSAFKAAKAKDGYNAAGLALLNVEPKIAEPKGNVKTGKKKKETVKIAEIVEEDEDEPIIEMILDDDEDEDNEWPA